MKKEFSYRILLSIFLQFGCEKLPEVGNGYLIQIDPNNYKVLTDTSNTVIVFGHILDAAADDNYILLVQKPVDRICECNPECFKTMSNYDKKSYTRCKKAFEESAIRSYWIINKLEKSRFNSKNLTHSNVYGPYSKDEYLQKRIEFEIPSELIINFDL